jgi:hypothetical protein
VLVAPGCELRAARAVDTGVVFSARLAAM